MRNYSAAKRKFLNFLFPTFTLLIILPPFLTIFANLETFAVEALIQWPCPKVIESNPKNKTLLAIPITSSLYIAFPKEQALPAKGIGVKSKAMQPSSTKVDFTDH